MEPPPDVPSTRISLDAFSSAFYGLSRMGRYPSRGEVRVLEEYGVTVFVDLTEEREDLPGYPLRKARRISFPITDRSIPRSVEAFIAFTTELMKLLADGEVLYIHCKGGHGRSGIVVATLISLMLLREGGVGTSTAGRGGEEWGWADAVREGLHTTSIIHARRKVMNPKYKRAGVPPRASQKAFVTFVVRYISSVW